MSPAGRARNPGGCGRLGGIREYIPVSPPPQVAGITGQPRGTSASPPATMPRRLAARTPRDHRQLARAALALTCGGCQQAQVAGAGDRLGPAVGTELGIQAAHVCLDGVPRDIQFASDFRRGQVRRTARLPELAEEAHRTLPAPVEYHTAARFLFQYGITKDELISRMGGSPLLVTGQPGPRSTDPESLLGGDAPAASPAVGPADALSWSTAGRTRGGSGDRRERADGREPSARVAR